MAYATIDDLETRWRPLSIQEKQRALVLLEDAALRLDLAFPPPADLTPPLEAVRVIVSCEMVKRALAAPGGIGVSSVQQGAGPYQETLTYTNPSGDLYLTKADRKLLGGGQSAYSIDLFPPVPVVLVVENV